MRAPGTICAAVMHRTIIGYHGMQESDPQEIMQSVYHGFGVAVPIEKVMKVDRLHLCNAITAVMEDVTFQVSTSAKGPPLLPWLIWQSAFRLQWPYLDLSAVHMCSSFTMFT